MIYTSSYKNIDIINNNVCSISGDRGKSVDYKGKCYPKLAPKLSFWKEWHSNIGVIDEKENNYFYIKEYYEQVLSNLDPELVYNDLDGNILLCYEDNMEFCHRHIVAAWLEIMLGIDVFEVKENDIVTRPQYIKEYLKKVMDIKEKKRQ